MNSQGQQLITLGKISSVYGVKGWVKVYSYTDPMDKILDYSVWNLEKNGTYQEVRVDKGRSHGKGMVAHIVGVDDRDTAVLLTGSSICVSRDLLPPLEDGEYYWFQLEGLRVRTQDGQDLGAIHHMMSAGTANDVMVVRGDDRSLDREERLIPYLPERVVKDVDIEAGIILVDWQPDY